MESETEATPQNDNVSCAECGTLVGEDRMETDGGVFCPACFENLKAQIHEAIAAQSKDINYPMGILGALLGGLAGAAVWWGFTIVTSIAFGLIAVVIGFAAGKGATMFTGNKRSVGLQGVALVVSGLAFFYASYLVNRTFVLRAMEEQGQTAVLPYLPDPQLMYDVVALDFGLFDIVFLAIVLWQAWKIPAPYKLAN